MQHLTPEEMARLVDEGETESEADHLAMCASCRAELKGMRGQIAALKAMPAAIPPADGWAKLEGELRSEGLIRDRSGAAPRVAWKAVAAITLFAAGSVTGGAAVSLRNSSGSLAAAPAAQNVAEAAANLRAAEEAYLTAVQKYTELTSSTAEVDPIERLAALEGILLTTGAALRDAPADPVINNYHLTALGMRDALLRQMAEVEGEQWY